MYSNTICQISKFTLYVYNTCHKPVRLFLNILSHIEAIFFLSHIAVLYSHSVFSWCGALGLGFLSSLASFTTNLPSVLYTRIVMYTEGRGFKSHPRQQFLGCCLGI